MPRIRYKAYDGAGTLVEGEIEAASPDAAIAMLFDRKLYPFDAVAAEGKARRPWWQAEITLFPGLPAEELAGLTRELSTFLSAGVTLDDALTELAGEGQSRRVRAIVRRLGTAVREGGSLSSAIEAEGRAFPAFYASMIRAGEAGGTLDRTLAELAEFLTRSSEASAKLRSALIYPAILGFVALGAILLITFVLVPNLLPLFEGAGRSPPFVFELLAGFSRAVTENTVLSLAALGIFTVLLVATLSNGQVRSALSDLFLRLPVVGRLIAKSETARLARTLGALLRGGVPIVQALGIVEGVLSNRRFRGAVARVTLQVKEGVALRRSLAETGLLPSLALRLISTGEETGRLDEMLTRTAEILEGHVQRQVERLLGILTPVLTLLIGAGVGGLLLSVMSAILSVNDLALQ